MISSEKAFELLPYAVDIYEKLNFDSYRKKLQLEYAKKKKLDPVDAGIDAFKYILKNSSKVKDEFFEIVAIVDDKTVEEVKLQPFTQTIATIKEVFTDKELVDFFKSAMQ